MSQEALIGKVWRCVRESLPLIIQPTVAGANLRASVENDKEFKESIEANILKYGAILFRQFTIDTVAEFEGFIKALSGELLEYRERSSPRNHVSGGIYTSTEYPANQSIFLHNENSYAHTWPSRLFFFCHTLPEQGGETPIADCRRVLSRLAPEIVKTFSQKGIRYVRNFSPGIGLSWEIAFQTKDRSVVEEYCRQSGYEYEWIASDHLRTRRIGPAIIKHPRTGDAVWFNHAAVFHVSTLEPMVRKALLTLVKEEHLPNQTYYGDGAPIEPAVLDQIREAYHQETMIFPWESGDILMLDNLLVAHGRRPYVGRRRVLVGMAK
jgi:alpha-ketoglutarate-dependent taurine dioxygenase